jgi:hypothetical protein
MPRPHHVAREDALAGVVLDRYLRVRRGEAVTIESWSHALPWARALVVEARRRGARPLLVVEDEAAYFRSLATVGARGTRASRGAPRPAGGAHVYLDGPEEFPRLFGLSAADRDRALARHDGAWWSDARRHRTRAVRLAIADATPTAAVRYGVDRDAWERELLRASLLDPALLRRSGERLLRGLGRARRLRVSHPNGTDLTAERSERAPFVDQGRSDPRGGVVWARIPAGLLLLPLRSTSADGRWEVNRPSHDRFARPPAAVGGRFRFRRGRLGAFEFDRGGEPFAAAQARFGRGRLRAVALTVGLNPRIHSAPELLGLAEGTVGLLLAEGPYRPGGSRPRFSFLGPISDADIEVDGRPWLRRGRPVAGRPR